MKAQLMQELHRNLQLEKGRVAQDRTSAAARGRMELLEDLIHWSEEILSED